MKNNLFLTTALVATSFVAGNAMAEEMSVTDFVKETALNGEYYLTGTTGTMDHDIDVTGQVTLHDAMTVATDEENENPTQLNVTGFFTETNAGSNVSGIDVNINKDGENGGGLILGNTLTAGNITMGDGTFVGLYTHTTEDYSTNSNKTLTVANGKTLTFEGNNTIGSINGGEGFQPGTLTITGDGSVVNKGALTVAADVTTDLTNSGNIVLKKTLTGNVIGGELTLKNGGKLAGDIIGETVDEVVGKATAVNIDLGTTTTGEGDEAVTIPNNGNLSEMITGDINAEVLNVNSGAVTFDTNDADLGSVNVAEDAMLTVSETLDAEVTNNGQLSATADKIEGAVINNGYYFMSDGELAANVEGSGSVIITGDVSIADAIPAVIDEESGEETSPVAAKTIANDIVVGVTGVDENGDPIPMFAGSLTANANNVKGAVEIANGTYDVTGGTIAHAVSGEGTLNISGDDVISDAVLSAANIAVADGGILTTDASNLASENVVANSGTVALTGGTLTQAISGGTTNIKGNVALGDSLDFGDGAVNVAEGATLDAGSNSLTTSDAVNFAAGSTLAFNADGSQEQVINGTANLEGNVAVQATYAAGVNSSTVKIAETIADTSEDESGQFTVAGNNLYNVSIDDKGNLVAEKKSGAEIAASTGANANEGGTIAALTSATSDNPILNNIINNVNEMLQSNNAGDVRVALDAVTALAPEVTPVAQQTQTENINQIFGAISTRLSGGSVASRAEGKASGDELFENGAMWVQMLYNHADKDDTRKAKGYEADSTGVAFGFEKQINDAVKAGIGYAYTNTDVDGFKRDTDIDTHTAFVYGEYKPSSWFVNAVASYNWSDYDETKYVINNRVTADYDVESLGLQAMTGYDMDLCNGTIFTPEAGLRYVHMMQDGYKDKAGQYVYGNDSDLLTGVVGAKVSHDFELENGWNLRPEFRLAATYDISADDGNSIVSLANGSAYSVKGEKLDRLGMEAELGVTADVTDDVSVSLGYQGRFRDHYEDHTGLINAKFKF